MKYSRLEKMSKGKIYWVYYDETPEVCLFEGSKSACLKWLKESGNKRAYDKGEIRVGQLILEIGGEKP